MVFMFDVMEGRRWSGGGVEFIVVLTENCMSSFTNNDFNHILSYLTSSKIYEIYKLIYCL